jgi:hypothetical protein
MTEILQESNSVNFPGLNYRVNLKATIEIWLGIKLAE